MTVSTELRCSSLPDAQKENDIYSNIKLDWVGMTGIALPIEIAGRPINALVDVGTDLQGQKGIHMSRLYQTLDGLTQHELTPNLIQQALEQILISHSHVSSKSSLRLYGDILLSRPSLVSHQHGWKAYPFEINANFNKSFIICLKVGVPYSSTCPSATALSTQVIQQQFAIEFEDETQPLYPPQVFNWLAKNGLPATPHSQRSWAWVTIALKASHKIFPIIELINQIENVLSTPVQTVVKRNDEQAFAIANAQNLMFCEDAARKLVIAFRHQCHYDEVNINIEHQESLHAHNAVVHTHWKRSTHAA